MYLLQFYIQMSIKQLSHLLINSPFKTKLINCNK
nr:MAG TPA: hypothetical protein [Caudoviricetes sp.]